MGIFKNKIVTIPLSQTPLQQGSCYLVEVVQCFGVFYNMRRNFSTFVFGGKKYDLLFYKV